MTDSSDHDANETHAEDLELPAGLPEGAAICPIAFVSEPGHDHEVLLKFPAAIGRCAVRVSTDGSASPDAVALSILRIPAAPKEEGEWLTAARAWVEAAATGGEPRSHMMTLQGAQIIWSQDRMAVLALAERLDAILAALIEVAYYDAELRGIERTLGETWPQLEADMPLAFEFQGQSISKRQQLHQRFGQVLLIRACLARIGPHIHCPHLHPPTLASQVAERLRERNRMMHRHEFLGAQIEVFERVYELCGQRVSDFMLTRSSNTLEWVIIILLLTQILFMMFEYLTSLGQ